MLSARRGFRLVSTNAQAFARALTKSLTEPPLARISLRQARIGYCPACGTSVRTDDVLGVIGAGSAPGSPTVE